ncbi:hypothetical protein, partial [Acinetobacter towneri]|uniref:hypothetical protein n=1 Tax=Acinetobacter towneri TaxID=202956 RepID=UPI0034D67A16
ARHLAGQSEPARQFLGLQHGPTRVPFDAGDALLCKTYRPLALRQLMNLLAARLRACTALRLHALRQRQAPFGVPHRAGLGKHHQASLPGLAQGPPPLSFLLQSAGDPLIEAFQPLLLGLFLSIERAQRLS